MTSLPVLILLAVCALCLGWAGFAAYALVRARSNVRGLQRFIDATSRQCRYLEEEAESLRQQLKPIRQVTKSTIPITFGKALPGMKLGSNEEPYLIREEAI